MELADHAVEKVAQGGGMPVRVIVAAPAVVRFGAGRGGESPSIRNFLHARHRGCRANHPSRSRSVRQPLAIGDQVFDPFLASHGPLRCEEHWAAAGVVAVLLAAQDQSQTEEIRLTAGPEAQAVDGHRRQRRPGLRPFLGRRRRRPVRRPQRRRSRQHLPDRPRAPAHHLRRHIQAGRQHRCGARGQDGRGQGQRRTHRLPHLRHHHPRPPRHGLGTAHRVLHHGARYLGDADFHQHHDRPPWPRRRRRHNPKLPAGALPAQGHAAESSLEATD